MTSSLPLVAAVPLVTGLLSASVIGAPATEHRQQAGNTSARPAERVQPAGTAASHRPAAAPGPADVVEHVAADAASEQRRVLDYWTPRRMAAAVPLDPLVPLTRVVGRVLDPLGRAGSAAGARRVATAARTAGARWTAGGLVSRTTGRVFLTLGGSDFVCSASSVKSANRDLVVTAGHCVKDGTGAWADNWTFVPGYDRGRRPYGQFTARRMFVAGPWARTGDDSFDLGMVAVGADKNGKHLTDVVGGQDIAFGTPRGRQAHGFGFPADRPYDGEHLVYCAGPLHDDPNGQTSDQGLRCDMTAGSSGGPWLSGFDAVTGRGTIISVSSFKYSDDRHSMYGPYFGDSARELYTTAHTS
ncbi:peptidase [Streptosporangium fragile]|uniref:Peptidase n=1 Tax=Streptosporangium fragile TaxID=46186 RepID=A0ABP6ISP9_9ACTN